MAQQKSVTLVISHLLDPQHSQRYEEWLGKIMPIAAEFPGHLGANVIRPAAGQNLWSVIIRFDTLEHLYAVTKDGRRCVLNGLTRWQLEKSSSAAQQDAARKNAAEEGATDDTV